MLGLYGIVTCSIIHLHLKEKDGKELISFILLLSSFFQQTKTWKFYYLKKICKSPLNLTNL